MLIVGMLVSVGIPPLTAQTADDAISLEQQGKLPEAAQAWRAVIARDPKDAGAFASLGVVLSKQRKYPEAVTTYRKALALSPKLPGIELNLGLAEFKQGHFSNASISLQQALVADPLSTQARTLLGLSYYGAKQYDLATQYLEPAAKQDPYNAERKVEIGGQIGNRNGVAGNTHKLARFWFQHVEVGPADANSGDQSKQVDGRTTGASAASRERVRSDDRARIPVEPLIVAHL